MMATIGAGMSAWWLLVLVRQWARDGYFPIDGGEDFGIGVSGVLVFAVAWVWSLVTSLSILHTAKLHVKSHRDTETQRTEKERNR
jgi:hypothetical protein